MERDFAKDLLDFIDKSPTSFHAVKSCKDILLKNNFKELDLRDQWDIRVGGKYFVTKNDSAIVAFTIACENIEEEGFRIIGSHTDAPSFRIKPHPEMVVEKNYMKLNTEAYGGPILNTWMDRPLAMAGRVSIKSEDVFRPKNILININKPVCIIPNLAIHMNKNVNSGIELNKQVDMLPLLGTLHEKLEKENFLGREIGKELNIQGEDILDFDLFLYEYEKGSLMGMKEEMISASRLDNLAMVHASINALSTAKGCKGVNVVAAFDNEEVGSTTKQGADSPMLKNILERITLSLGKNKEDFFRSIYSSFMISADMAHAIHPNKTEKHDPTNRPMMNKGPVIKINANQSYTSDSYSIGVYEGICKEAKVPYQKFVNRSDERGGSTIGPISSSHLDIPSVDIGNPILAMHSIRELGGVLDHYYVYKSFLKYYEL